LNNGMWGKKTTKKKIIPNITIQKKDIHPKKYYY